MRILLATFANRGATNMGIGRHYNSLANVLEKQGHELIFFHHPRPLILEKVSFRNMVLPMYGGFFSKTFGKLFKSLKPDAIHIQSEIGVGIAVRNYCVAHSIPFTCSYHTNWEAYPWALVNWPYLRWFYKPTHLIHVSTESMKRHLQEKGILNPIEVFPLGVDLKSFYYDPDPSLLKEYPRPYFMTVSRLSKEKNVEAFLKLSLPGTKFVIGNGPRKRILQKRYPNGAIFLPYENIRKLLSLGDVFVFPSLKETFGLTSLEALACGLPVAAFPVPGPKDIIEEGVCGYTSDNLEEAALACLSLKKTDCIQHAHRYSWENTAHHFLKHQAIINKR